MGRFIGCSTALHLDVHAPGRRGLPGRRCRRCWRRGCGRRLTMTPAIGSDSAAKAASVSSSSSCQGCYVIAHSTLRDGPPFEHRQQKRRCWRTAPDPCFCCIQLRQSHARLQPAHRQRRDEGPVLQHWLQGGCAVGAAVGGAMWAALQRVALIACAGSRIAVVRYTSCNHHASHGTTCAMAALMCRVAVAQGKDHTQTTSKCGG